MKARSRATAGKPAAWKLAFSTLAFVAGVTTCCNCLPDAGRKQPTRLIILVPGTFSKNSEWSRVDVPVPTLAKSLRQQLRTTDSLVAFQWSGQLSHQARLDAAIQLADYVANQRPQFDEIHLVGHSYGGSVALAASGQLNERVESVICLGTPHVYVKCCASSEPMNLPVYCPPSTLENVYRIITIDDVDDRVVDEISNALLCGVTERQALDATKPWELPFGEITPAEAKPTSTQRLFESSNVFASRDFKFADVQIVIDHNQAHLLGITPHTRLHDPAISQLLLRVISLGGE
ncbi:esterase/lipase family protein [Aporhodopirellula aestuarii]|uniref:Alpha/beta hydrolase n=1 Tax=Aporhodopirellula aestuarii TaxID=2950107 RepID=A0ABT0UEH9_9BACT|nr:alpha/beta hydrolase [Aporhodopirellula aestuarii]MCM2374666.1 alpha/beta hydrolase [Aporhodopirellula aestuarii]